MEWDFEPRSYFTSVKYQSALTSDNRDFKQIATANSTTAVMTEEVWGEQVAVAR